LTPQSFRVTDDDVTRLREVYRDGAYGGALAEHLRARGVEGMELLQYRFTSVVKLYHHIQMLVGQARYDRFFAETATEFAELQRRMSDFLRRSSALLTAAARLSDPDTPATYVELVQERREALAESCRNSFRELALFLARAVLRSEASEKHIVCSLRNAGFSAAEPMNLPDFPIDSLTVLALGIFVYLAVIGIVFAHVPGVSQQSGSALAIALKIALARLLSVGVIVWLIQRRDWFRRKPDQPPRFFAYVLCGLVASGVAVAVCLAFDAPQANLTGVVRSDLPLVLLTFVLCTAVAFCCNDWIHDTVPPRWLRFVEAIGCGSLMAVGALLIYLGDLLPSSTQYLSHWQVATWTVLPSVLALIIGGSVPHIYRSASRAATAGRSAAMPRTPATSPTPISLRDS
jgi:hypothetical protein